MIRDSKKTLAINPDAAVQMLKETLIRVADHPDLSDTLKAALVSRLEGAIRETTIEARTAVLRNEEREKLITVELKEKEAASARKTMEERIEAQFRVFKSLMNVGRM